MMADTNEVRPAYDMVVDWLPIILSLLAFAISIYSVYVATKQFEMSSRPYVWAMNHAFVDGNNTLKEQPSHFQIICNNAPALIVFAEYKFYLCDGDEKKLLHEFRIENEILHPHEKTQYTYGWDGFASTFTGLEKEQRLFREIRLAYRPFGSKRSYFFEQASFLDARQPVWTHTNQHAT